MAPFDPYHQWLGIPETARPISKYRLLALVDFEADRGVISAAAEQRIIYLRTMQAGEHAVLVADLLNEVSQARVCLLDGKSKSRYDTQLRSQLEPAPEQDPLAFAAKELAAISSRPATRPRGGKPFWKEPWAIPAAAGGIVVLLLLMWLFGSGGTDTSDLGHNTTTTTLGNQQKTQPTASNQTSPVKVIVAPTLAVAPFDAAQAKAHQQAWSKYLGVPVEFTNSIGMKLMLIPPGEFMMGSNSLEDSHKPTHKVTLTQPFQLGMHEVTQGQYTKVVGINPSKYKGLSNPVEQVNWAEAVAFCKLLSDLPEEKASGHVYRLPTEAEWEYACRAGTTTAYSFSDSDSELDNYAWYVNNSGNTTHPVGGKKPNGWGLYDLHGNVLEWCQDWYGDYPSSSLTNPTGAALRQHRVFRGGCYDIDSVICRSAYRRFSTPRNIHNALGFRVVCILSDDKQPTTTAITNVESKPAIPDDAVQFGGHHYQIVTDKVTWMQARNDAALKGGYLLRVNSQPEFDFISTLFISRNLPRCWIDGSRLLLGGNNWLYSNGDRVDLTVFPHKIFENADSDLFLNLARNKANQVCVWDGTLRFKGKTELDIYIIEWEG
jgi:formylglycine-generating enzyme required for sulfatase activity